MCLSVCFECCILIAISLHHRMSVSSRYRDAEQLTGSNVRCRVKPCNIRSSRAPDRRIQLLCASSSELHARLIDSHLLNTSSLSCNKRLVVHYIENGCLNQLRFCERCFDSHNRLIGEYKLSFSHGAYVSGKPQALKIG